MKDAFFGKNDIRINSYLSKALLFFVPVLPVLMLLVDLSLIRFERFSLPLVSLIFAVGLILPALLRLFGVPASFLKYFIVMDISIMAGLLEVYPHTAVYLSMLLGIVISLLYIDPKLTVYICFMDYIIMIVSIGIRSYLTMGVIDRTAVDELIVRSVEYAAISVIACVIAYLTRKRLEDEQELAMLLEDANNRYELALDSSKDVIYEYDIAKDELKYYGSLRTGRVKGSTVARHPNIFEHLMATLQRGHMLHPDDVRLIEGVVSGNSEEKIQVRMLSEDDYDWFEVESNVIYQNNSAVRIVGNIRNITLEKEEEQEFLNVSRKDALTGFYDKMVGIRIIRRHMTQVGRTDTQQFLYVLLENAEAIAETNGAVFLDALLLRLADILKDEVADMDLPVRFSQTEFVLYLANRTPAMLEQMTVRIRQEAAHVYVGGGNSEGLKLRIEAYPSLAALEMETGASESDPGFFASEDDSYRNDMVSFAFNLLERTEDLDNAVNLLLDRTGSMYRLDSVRILRGTSMRGIYRCVYEWRMAEALEEGITSILNNDVDIDSMKQRSDMYIYDSPEISEDGGCFVFQGDAFTGGSRDMVAEKLDALARIMSTFVGKKYADSANRAKSDFLSSMSHEIRTPMNAIAGFAELILQEEDAGETILNYADNIKTSSNNLLAIINDILHLSKIEPGKFEIIPERYFLHGIVEEVRNIMLIQIGSSDVEFVLNMSEDICDGLVGDALRIRQILINLLNNAVKFTSHGQVGLDMSWVSEGPENGVLKGVVWDTGMGIKEEDIDMIFSAYEQADLKKNHGIRGTGLGLAITRELVELMNGTIWVESEYGGGTKMIFSIRQSVFDNSVYDYTKKSEHKVHTTHTVPFTAPWARVLIVDDNKVNIEVAKGLLSKYEVQMVTAAGGREALAVLELDTDFDLIFMDHLMPGMDGIETTQAIRAMGNPVLEKIPIVALSANAVKGMEESFLLSGMDSYLAKPIDLGELAKIMMRFIPDAKKAIY